MLLLLLGCAGGGASKPRWSQAPDIDVAGYSTFAWSDRSGKPPVTILDNQIRAAIRTHLTEKGYVESTDNPDFLVHHEAVEASTVSQGSPVRIGVGIGTGRGPVGGSVGTSVGVGGGERVNNQFRITIRALAEADKREAWVGSTAAIGEQPEQGAIDRAVAGVMKGFPDRR